MLRLMVDINILNNNPIIKFRFLCNKYLYLNNLNIFSCCYIITIKKLVYITNIK